MTAGTTIGSSRVESKISVPGKARRRPSAARVPITVASAVAPAPMTRLLMIERRQTSDTQSSSNQRVD